MILPEMMLEQYNHNDGKMIKGTAWKWCLKTLRRGESADSAISSYARPHVAVSKDKMKNVHMHSKQFHLVVNNYSCEEHTNLVLHSNNRVYKWLLLLCSLKSGG